MNIEKQVCSIDQSKRLKELGIEQKSHFIWYEVSNGDDEGDFEKEGVEWHPVLCQYDKRTQSDMTLSQIDDDLTTSDGEFCSHKPDICNAYTVAEIGVMLPNYLKTWYGNDAMGEMGWMVVDLQNMPEWVDVKIYNSEAEARATMLIYLLENNLTTAEECNSRLNA